MKNAYLKRPLNERGHTENCSCCVCKYKRGEIKGRYHPRWKEKIRKKYYRKR